jgi:hypothetical protein
MRTRLGFISAGVLCLFWAADAGARPIPGFSLSQLTDESDLIVVGKITSIHQVGVSVIDDQSNKVTCKLMAAELIVDQVLKGSTGEKTIGLQFVDPSSFMGYSIPGEGTVGVFFLKQAGKAYGFLSPHYPFAVAMAGVASQGETALDPVVFQVAAVLGSADAPKDQKRKALDALRSTINPVSTQTLRAATRDHDPDVRLGAMAVLLLQNDTSQISAIIDVLLGSEPGASRESIHNVAYGLALGKKDPKLIPDFLKLQGSPDPIIRRAAASALMNTGSREAIDGLVRALDDDNSEVRYFGVVGLAKITDQPDWKPDQPSFRSHEETYTDYWRRWAKARQ